jgi:hypothetical protein
MKKNPGALMETISLIQKNDALLMELKSEKEFHQNCKEAAEFWKEKYDNYHKEMDEFINRTKIMLDIILKKQSEQKKDLEDIFEILKATDGALNWIKKN